jgi:cobalt-zinc-cadmium efflux system membrane fusion protein
MNRFPWLMLTLALLAGCAGDEPAVDEREEGEHAEGEEHADEAPTGPNGGHLLEQDGFTLELAIYESGVPPEYHAWASLNGESLAPADVDLSVELARLGGAIDRIDFSPQGEFLRGNQVVAEPHSFDVTVEARHAGRDYEFAYESHEGRVEIPADVARAAGIGTAIAGPGTIREELMLYGAISADLTRVRDVGARFPGVIRSVTVEIGETVRAGQTLATIEANDSLQTYAVTAPIGGTITARHAAAGEATHEEGLFTITDFGSVWAELDVFARDRPRIAAGLPVTVTAAGTVVAEGTIAYLAPAGDRSTQSILARVVLDNANGRWTPGQFVEGRVTIGETPVDLAVPLSSLQRFREFDVVFAQVGETYEVRMLSLGRRDSRAVEVLGGLEPGTVIVTEQSYLIKADIEKAGASHDH